MKFNLIAVFLFLFILSIGCEKANKDSNSNTIDKSKIKIELYITIGEYSSRILSYASDGREIGRIPAETEVKILDRKRVKMGQITGTWFEVDFNGISGWVSEFSTTGEIIEKELLDVAE